MISLFSSFSSFKPNLSKHQVAQIGTIERGESGSLRNQMY